MKHTIRTTAAIFAAIAVMTACGNARAKNEIVKTEEKKEIKSEKHAIELNANDFNAKVYDLKAEGLKYLGDKPAIIDFYATWCGPCMKIAPVLEEIAKEYSGQIYVYKVDVDKAPEVAQAFSIRSIPAILYVPMEGQPSMTLGARDKNRFKTEIDSILLGK